MAHSRAACRLALALLAAACSHHENPVLPTDPGGGSGVEVLTVGVTADVSQLTAGSTTATKLHISALHSDGTPPKDGTEVAVNTNIGSFGADSAGKPTLLAKTTLVAGKANLDFFPGSDTGVANILAQVGTNVGRLNLPIVTAPPAPVANFTFATAGLRVLFTDASTGATSWRWDFGDNTPIVTETSPSHTYTAAGTYVVTLTVTNAGGSANKSQFVTVSLGSGPSAAFEFTVSGHQVNFVDKSTGGPTSWSWAFGDSGTSTQQNPIHTYAVAGAYTVTLTARNSVGENSTSQVVTIAAGTPPKASFDFTTNGLQANFVDTSTNSPTDWSWLFGDGGSSTSQNPIHTYPDSGNYTVTLIAKNGSGQDTASKIVTVSKGSTPVAKFAFSVNGKTVNFVDQSTGTPTSWSWDFGDGSLPDTRQNPVHTYNSAGNFTVTLTVTNAAGSNSKSDVVTIAAGTPPTANFTFNVNGFSVNFLDRSSGAPTGWSWDFGDGSLPDTRQNPIHTYGVAGSYTVELTATNAAGSNKKSDVVTVPSPPVANFDFTVNGLKVTFNDLSTSTPTSWSWSFGDGGTSTVQNPTNTYAAAGTYTVKLTATNAGGSSSATKTVTVP